MEFKITFQSYIALIIHVYLFAFAGAQNFKRDDKGVSFASFVKASSVKLNVTTLTSLKVSELEECAFECIDNKECYSVNFGGTLGGKYSCELLGTDRFRESSKLVDSEEFDHYYIKVSRHFFRFLNYFSVFIALTQKVIFKYRNIYLIFLFFQNKNPAFTIGIFFL